MGELELLAVCLCKGYLQPITNYLEDCGCTNIDDAKILLKPPIIYCVKEFNDGYSTDNVKMLNKTMKIIYSKYK